MRSDARRNQQRILDAAHEQITTRGPDVPMENIAAAAGVGVGTLYRHYPTKADLVHAILTEYIDTLITETEDATTMLRHPGDAKKAIVNLLDGFLETASTNRALKQAAATLNGPHADTAQEARAKTALTVLLSTAHADGDIRFDVTADDILLLMNTAPTHLPPTAQHRWLDICITGISTAVEMHETKTLSTRRAAADPPDRRSPARRRSSSM